MESMEPISALYTTDYPEIHPEESCRSAGSPLGSPSAPSYNEDLMHKVGLVMAWALLVDTSTFELLFYQIFVKDCLLILYLQRSSVYP